MNYKPMLSFLSEDSIKAHNAYLKNLSSRHSVEEKSLPFIKGKSAFEISKMNIDKRVKSEILPLLFDIELHCAYFDSFTENPLPCREIKRYFSSEDDFCYQILTLARRTEYGFVYVVKNSRGEPEIKSTKESQRLLYQAPLLALDVCEHAYFSDYGFEREEYLKRALSHLDLTKLFSSQKQLDSGTQK